MGRLKKDPENGGRLLTANEKKECARIASALYYEKKWVREKRRLQMAAKRAAAKENRGKKIKNKEDSADHPELRQVEKEASEALAAMRNMRQIGAENLEADSGDDADEESDEELGLR
ncbi:hypothetical protein C8R44DRAFT_738101 [Mycena epipterygia]|nr:hypothetical protein C8R44DRAFT_738101 [Mycena epipterygia]